MLLVVEAFELHQSCDFRGASLLAAHPSGRHLVVGDNAGRFDVVETAGTPDLLSFVVAGQSNIIFVLDLAQGQVEQ